VMLAMGIHANDGNCATSSQNAGCLANEYLLLHEVMERVDTVDNIEAIADKRELIGGAANQVGLFERCFAQHTLRKIDSKHFVVRTKRVKPKPGTAAHLQNAIPDALAQQVS